MCEAIWYRGNMDSVDNTQSKAWRMKLYKYVSV